MKSRVQHNGFDEAFRYYRNARGLLSKCRVQDDLYEDMKPVREAFGTAWLAVDLAIKSALLERGLAERQIPRSWESLRAMVVKNLAVHNGKLVNLLNTTYKVVHLGGYYYGDFVSPVLARGAFDVARKLIETLSGRKIG